MLNKLHTWLYLKIKLFSISLLLYNMVYAYLKCVSWLCATLYDLGIHSLLQMLAI